MNDKDFKESMDGLPQELERVYGQAWRTVATLDDLTADDARRHRESQRIADETSGRSAYNKHISNI